MNSHSIIAWLIIGAIAGWLAGVLVKGGGFGLIGDIVVGIIGAFIAALAGVVASAVAYIWPEADGGGGSKYVVGGASDLRKRLAADRRFSSDRGFIRQAAWRRPKPSPIQLAPANTRSMPRKMPST